MRINNVFIVWFFCLTSITALGQKVKYKDIFPDLDAKNYSTALADLQAFIFDPKNSDHPNANLQMGLYFEELVDKSDLIKDSTIVLESADSALIYLKKAKEYIDDKELKKNDGFYKAFYRRDLRTGEFGIKISDVHLDLENKIKRMEAIQEQGRQIFKDLFRIDKCNTYLFEAYKSLFKQYPDFNNLLLEVSEAQIDTLKEMSEKESIMKDTFDDMRKAVSKIGKKGFSPELVLRPIETYGVDGLTEVDVYQNDVKAWEYGEWAFQTVKQIDGRITELKEQLVKFNQQLKRENEKLKGLETIDYASLTHEIDAYILNELAELDEDPLPVALFTVLIKKNEYDYMTNPERNPKIGMLDDVDFQLMFTDSLVSVLELLEEDVNKLQDAYVVDGQKKYKSFIKGEYGGDFGILKLRKGYDEFLSNSKQKWIMLNREYTERSKWGISEDEKDTIYLGIENDTLYKYNVKGANYSLAVLKDHESNTFVAGIDMKNKGKGFVAMVSNARKIIWKEPVDLGKFSFNGSPELVSGSFVPSEQGKLTAYFYSSATIDANKGQSNMLVVHADRVGQVSWTNEIVAKNKPLEVKFNDLVKETVFYMMTDEQIDQAGPGERAYYVIDRSGKIR